jgi:hypothetical protein
MAGYSARKEGAAAVHDDLYVSAVAFKADGGAAAVLSYDVCLFDLELAAEIKGALCRACRLTPEQVFLNTTHNHAGPAIGRYHGADEDPQYRRSLAEKGVAALQAAMDDLAPATFSAGAAPLDIGCNRRERRADGQIILGHNPAGPTLHELTAWRFARRGRPSIVLFSSPMHGTTLGQDNLVLSAEWMGSAVAHFEARRPRTRAVFIQGCGADQDPYYSLTRGRRGTFEEVEAHGMAAATALDQALKKARRLSPLPLAIATRQVSLSGKEDPADKRVLPIHALRLGDALLLALGCEAFVEYAMYGRRVSPFTETLVIGYTDGNIGYLCTADVFPEGGYEVRSTRVAPESEQIVKQAMRGVMAELAG